MRRCQAGALMVATLAMGLMAGVFFLYSTAIMPGLDKADDRTFVGAFQQIDIAIEQPRFAPVFIGASLFTGLAAALHLSRDSRRALPWIVAALALFLAVVVVGVNIHVPRNHGIRDEGDPDLIADLAAVRERFDESRWAAWNLVRFLATTAAFGLLAWALVLRGRLDRGPAAIKPNLGVDSLGFETVDTQKGE